MQHIELRPNQDLLKLDFDGYKLSLDPIPIRKIELSEDNRPHHVRPNEHQYSYHHARLFGMQNHLVRDPWATGRCYYVDASRKVQRVKYDKSLGRLKPISAIFTLPLAKDSPQPELGQSDLKDGKTAGTYNCSLVFASQQHCLLSDGQGIICVLDTGNRASDVEWRLCSVFRPAEVDHDSKLSAGGCTLLDARLAVSDGKNQLHCIAMQVDHQPDRRSETLLYWFTLEQQDQPQSPEWIFHTSRMLQGDGYPRYCQLDYHASTLLVASNKPFHFVYDSQCAVLPSRPPQPKMLIPEEPQAYERYPFEWRQTMNEVILKFLKVKDVSYIVRAPVGREGLRVIADGTIVIDSAKFFAEIEAEDSTWSMDQKTLEVTMPKQATGIMWPFIFPGGPDEAGAAGSGDEATAEAALPPATSLDAPLEDCDFDEADETASWTLQRLSRLSHQVTHSIFLGSRPPLFSMALRAGAPAAFVLRHHVDACFWQFQPPKLPGDCLLDHVGTLNAFGYVQASKRKQKFLACSPDYEYAVICESEHRLYIYQAHSGWTSAGLRNRGLPQVSVGQHRFACLYDGEILGICCEKDVVLLLTERTLVSLHLGMAK